MIRTEIVILTVIPAVAFRQKLKSGGSGITILRFDSKQPGIASISKTSGEAIPADNTPKDLYSEEAFQEAIELTSGMPYTKNGGVHLDIRVVDEPAETVPEEEPEALVIDSAQYQKVLDAYTDKNGKLSYELLNKDLIQFAHNSKKVEEMLQERKDPETIRNYIITAKFGSLTDDPEFSEAKALKIAELLDEVYPKGVFKELNEELRKRAGEVKKA